ncbi:polysaccharide deacetylase [Spirochaetia bacterium]|nr:polysaccharide deacetylase [Spirochaetia bacterium]
MKSRIGLWLLVIGLILPLCPAFSKVNFGGLDLSDDNRLLFRADSVQDGAAAQNALFISRLTDLSLQQITAFPEKMELLDSNRVIQVRNAFGAVRIPVAGGLPRTVSGVPSFASGYPAAGGRVEDMAASLDGRWVLLVEAVSPAYGNLVLLDTQQGEKRIIAINVERTARDFPACWSPDSRVFVYSKGGRLYYYAVNPAQSASIDERYRIIGEGSINSVSWTRAGDFFYLRGFTVFRVRGTDIFARTLYADFLEIGAVAGKIPFDFDGNFDSFWIAPDSRSILLNKGGRNIFYYPLGLDDFNTTLESNLPYMIIPQSCTNINVLWSPTGTITISATVLKKDGPVLMLYRLSSAAIAAGNASFVPLTSPAGPNAALSPDGTKALFWGEKGIVLYDYVNWRVLQIVSNRPSLSCIWLNNEEFISGDDQWIERVRVNGERNLICLSSAAEYGFEESAAGARVTQPLGIQGQTGGAGGAVNDGAANQVSRILVRSGGIWFASDGTEPWWRQVNIPTLRSSSVTSGRYRVYLEQQSSGPYENLPMIRNTAGVGTIPLLSAIQYQRESGLSETPADNIQSGFFPHGSRNGLREVSLCFDLYDDDAGLSRILESLRRFGFRATFFMNGDFIRRSPSAVKAITEMGHEAASMFFAPIDLSDSRYRISGDFITRGLARNEDEFYRAAGGELSLFWHPPFYAASSEIITAAARAGYRTIGRDVDPMDWVSREEAKRLGVSQYSASDMVDRIMNMKRPGSIIPIRLGMLSGGRSDYLFLRIDVLLDALVRSGYTVVPVSTLIEHVR